MFVYMCILVFLYFLTDNKAVLLSGDFILILIAFWILVAKHLRKPWDVKFDKLNRQLKSGSSFIFVLYLNATSLWLIQRHVLEDQSKILAQIKFVISLRKYLSILSNILQQTQISRLLVSREISLMFRQRSVTVLVEESFLPSVSPPCLTRPQIMTLSPRPPSTAGLRSWEDIFHRPLHCGFGLQDVSSFSGHHCGPSRIALSPLYKPWALCVLRLRHSLANVSHRLITVNHQAAIANDVCLFVRLIDRYRWFVNWL